MTITQLKNKFLENLGDKYPKEENLSFFNLLAEHFLQLNRLQIALEPNKKLNDTEVIEFEGAIKKLRVFEPIQYIIGETEFFSLSFKVTPGVLIPRPETEELVQWILDEVSLKQQQDLHILDIGTGSGCIPISLKKHLPKAQISAIDISEEALKVANLNTEKNKVSVHLVHQDILSTQKLSRQFDVIVSNPPYVRELEKAEMQQNVLQYEPETALYVKDENPLLFYNKITKLAQEGLSKNGLLFFEINQYLGEETKTMVEEHGFRAELRKDMFGNFRMLKAQKR
ncbi:peptide chain release factor N(5)-glutamine methyltransferase [Zunongwangia profunda]|jgi:release factor glutamine methyltransferase|uniref:peptide chain release factor N(5)-glutamine methyltransferase n=1 Tax=Zunongwangia profunda TaxID=398743 RepID=UPI001D194DFF|nr:peptide chain release factor N(5)-glutamine methyltransferase [Zunongwangia profunda]MCC4230697.1 peptide chain release factor N(5)-glutamine methyltransferase [Zunongwangia profunda]|tara:strand:- start:42 stop:893 length:852 start_codon:yes stop_codon:yes gene_type:complete